jgi:hypothetical protein
MIRPGVAIAIACASISEDQNRTRREFCLGAGAHTHYWDGTSDEVAAEIDCCEIKKRTLERGYSSRQGNS